jgi:hypothetical protein
MPPRRADPLVSVSFRLRQTGADWLAKVADQHGVTKTDVIKAMFKYASTDYEKGKWTP